MLVLVGSRDVVTGQGRGGLGMGWHYVSELDKPQLAQGVADFAADFVGNVELDQAHVRRAERRVLFRRHLG